MIGGHVVVPLPNMENAYHERSDHGYRGPEIGDESRLWKYGGYECRQWRGQSDRRRVQLDSAGAWGFRLFTPFPHDEVIRTPRSPPASCRIRRRRRSYSGICTDAYCEQER